MVKLLLIALALIPIITHAQVYKCKVNGTFAYQQSSCADGEAGKVLIVPSQSTPVVTSVPQGIRPSEQQWLQQRQQEEQRAIQSQRQAEIEENQAAAMRDQRDRYEEAQKLLNKMPYGNPGDAAKRRDMLEHARILTGQGNGDAQQEKAPSMATPAIPPTPVPINDGRWLYSNDPQSNTFHGSDGDPYIRQGNQAWNPRTGERLNLH